MTDNIKTENNNVREFKSHRQRDISKIVKFVLIILILASAAFGSWKWFSKKKHKIGTNKIRPLVQHGTNKKSPKGDFLVE